MKKKIKPTPKHCVGAAGRRSVPCGSPGCRNLLVWNPSVFTNCEISGTVAEPRDSAVCPLPLHQVSICLECNSSKLRGLKRKWIRCSAQATVLHLKKFIAKKLNLTSFNEVNAATAPPPNRFFFLSLCFEFESDDCFRYIQHKKMA